MIYVGSVQIHRTPASLGCGIHEKSWNQFPRILRGNCHCSVLEIMPKQRTMVYSLKEREEG
jgi:hypothetical protein